MRPSCDALPGAAAVLCRAGHAFLCRDLWRSDAGGDGGHLEREMVFDGFQWFRYVFLNVF